MWMMLVALGCGVLNGNEDHEDRQSLPPSEMAQRLNAVENPIQQLAMLSEYLAPDPQRSEALCPQLTAGPLRRRCVEVQVRPHLWTPRSVSTPHQRPARGPGSERSTPEQLPRPYQDVAAAPCSDCDTFFETIDRAAEAAHAGDGPQAVGLCRSIDETRWRRECMFKAAEVRMNTDVQESYTDAVSLCAESEAFLADCLVHLHTLRPTPHPLTTQPRRWTKLQGVVESVRMLWAQWDPAFGEVAEGQIWAGNLLVAVMETREMAGNPLDFLPPQAAPHLRSAIAFRLAYTGELSGIGLADAQARMDDILATRSRRRLRDPMPPILRNLTPIWTEDASNEQYIRTIPYLRNDRRAVSDDPDTDNALAILEGAARATPVAHRILQDGLEHPHPLIAQTAARLHHHLGGDRMDGSPNL
ncbi:MAG: hypothetical protein AAFV53_17175 [Myxococcota bacterium]